jgi:hypothetical protein
MVIFPARNAEFALYTEFAHYTEFAIFTGLYILLILQHLANNLCSFTHFKMLFPAMVMDFVLLV